MESIQLELKELNRKYQNLKKINKDLMKVNNDLENKVVQGIRQLEEITSELKEFNIILD